MNDHSCALTDMKFRRKFCVNPYKTMRLTLGEMSFYKDWVSTTRGDPYPVIEQSGGALYERSDDGTFTVENQSGERAVKARLLGQHFPYASYEVVLNTLESAAVGFMLRVAPENGCAYNAETAPCLRVSLARVGESVQLSYELLVGGCSRGVQTDAALYPFVPGMRLILACRGSFFDVYIQDGKKPLPRWTIELPEFSEITLHSTFVNATAALWYEVQSGGTFTADSVTFYLDGGVSHADMRPIRYEDGTPMMTEGKLFLTMSSRMEAGAFQSVVSWNPSTATLQMEGALFFDCGDDRWCADVASSILYNRATGEWYLWACSFSHGHVLCHGTALADIRYGIHVIDVELMRCETMEQLAADSLGAQAGARTSFQANLQDDCRWMAKSGDEDPDFVYDRESGRWLMSICRLVEKDGKRAYRYFLFASDEPFDGYTYLDHTRSGENTGGSLVRWNGKLHLVCGSDFGTRAMYHVYAVEDLSTFERLRCDFDDGGFRGWGTLIPVLCGRRTRLMWMTFDRHGGSAYTWSYGNIYVFESDQMF